MAIQNFGQLAKRAAVIFAVASCGVATLAETPLGGTLQLKVANEILFSIRSRLGRDPILDPRLKIVEFDDSSFARLGAGELTAGQWSDLISLLSRAGAARIAIDKMFGANPPGGVPEIPEGAAPVTVGAFFASPIAERQALDLSGAVYDFESLVRPQDRDPKRLEELFATIPRGPTKVFGPTPEFLQRVAGVGNISYFGWGRFRPLQTDGPTRRVVRHLALAFADQVVLGPAGIEVSGHLAPVDANGFALANVMEPTATEHQMVAVWRLLTATASSTVATFVQPGDYVLILPNSFTGQTDFVDTPKGKMPGGRFVAMVANSVLTGQWLRPLNSGFWGLAVATLLGITCGLCLRARAFLLTITIFLVLEFLTAACLFAYYRIVTDWIFPAAAFALAATLAFIDAARRLEARNQRLTAALHGLVPGPRLRAILEKADPFQLAPSERVVTVMFVDIVGFSSYAETRPPGEVFLVLRGLFREIAAIVHQFGGVIDRSLGDGLLCYFGYSFGEDSGRDHANHGLECAIKIQATNIGRTLAGVDENLPVFPLRIGVNTAGVYIGDLGDERRLDFTLIGLGVNLAQRLEAACESNRILFSAFTHAMLTRTNPSSIEIQRRMIPIKHHAKLIEVFEYDPFASEPEQAAKAMQAYNRFHGIERLEPRWAVPSSQSFSVETTFGRADLTSFSLNGLALVLKTYLAKGVILQIEWRLPTGTVVAQGEVRWGRPRGREQFLHGIVLKNLQAAERERLLDELRLNLGGAQVAA